MKQPTEDVQQAGDLREAWFEGAQAVGLTAGTSTPDVTIDEVEEWLNRLALRGRAGRAAEPVEIRQKQAA